MVLYEKIQSQQGEDLKKTYRSTQKRADFVHRKNRSEEVHCSQNHQREIERSSRRSPTAGAQTGHHPQDQGQGSGKVQQKLFGKFQPLESPRQEKKRQCKNQGINYAADKSGHKRVLSRCLHGKFNLNLTNINMI